MWEFIATVSLEDLERYSTFKEACGIAIVTGATSGIAVLIAEDRDAATYVKHHTHRLGGSLQTVHFESDAGFVWLFEHPFGTRERPGRAEVAEGVTLILGTELVSMPTDFSMAAKSARRPFGWRLPFPKDSQLAPVPTWVAADAEVVTEAEVGLLRELNGLYEAERWEGYDRVLATLRGEREHEGETDAMEPGPPAGDAPCTAAAAPAEAEAAETATEKVKPTVDSARPVVEAGSMGLALASWPRTPTSAPAPPVDANPSDDSWGQTGRPMAGPWVRSGTTTLLLGLPKTSGITTFLLHLTRSVILGRDFVGFGTHRSPVVYLTTQSPASFRISSSQASLRLGAAAADKCVVYRDHVADRSWYDIMREAVALCHKNAARVLIIDGLDRFVTAGERGGFVTADAVLRGLALATNAGLAVVSAMHRLDEQSAPGYYEAVVRAADQQLSLVPIPHCDASLRELRAVSRFSDTPELVSLVFDPVASTYRATESPELYPGPHSIQYELTDMLEPPGDGASRRTGAPTPSEARTPLPDHGDSEESLIPHLKLFGRHRSAGDGEEGGGHPQPHQGDEAPGHFTLRPVHIAAAG